LALGLLTSTFAYIPKATLAAVIISAVIFMVEYEMIPLLWRTKSTCLHMLV
jgi:sodium-independent sulfate anion transporter 11